jgi:hypothetical protein
MRNKMIVRLPSRFLSSGRGTELCGFGEILAPSRRRGGGMHGKFCIVHAWKMRGVECAMGRRISEGTLSAACLRQR